MDNQFTILLFTRLFWPDIGGVPTYYSNLAYRLRLPVIVVTRKGNEVEQDFQYRGKVEIESYDLPKNLSFTLSFSYIYRLLSFIVSIIKLVLRNSEKTTYIIVGQARFFFLFSAWFLKKMLGVDYIIWLHGEEVPIKNAMTKSQYMEKYFLNHSSNCICNSMFTKNSFKTLIPSYSGKIEVIYPGVEDKFFEYCVGIDKSVELLKEKHDLNGKRILYTICRLDRRKGIDKVIESIPLIIKNFPNLMYLIGGTGNDDERLKEIVNRVKIENHVKFLGLIDRREIVAYHDLGEVFVMPNRILKNGDTEGFGIVFIEANARGKPVIGGNAGGSLDSIEDLKTGLLVDPKSIIDISNSICKILSSNDLYSQISTAGRQRALERFQWDKIAVDAEAKILNLIINTGC